MVEFLCGDALTLAIQKILAEPEGRFAVAFWGDGAAEKLHQRGQGDFQVICNLVSGATNPSEIRKLKRQNVRQCDTLHAKVYIGSKSLVVSSANVSTNGLGLEGVEQARWIEVGTRSDDNNSASKWFEEQWNNGRKITDGDLNKAEEAWNRRKNFRPTLLSIDDFDTSSNKLPLLTWYGEATGTVNQKVVRSYGVTKEIIENSIGISSHHDCAVLNPETWVLYWCANDEGRPYRRAPVWFYTGRFIPKAYRYKGERKYSDVVARSDVSPDLPFKFDKIATKLFYDTLMKDEFAELRSSNSGQRWFTKRRLDLMPIFWSMFKAEYQGHTDQR